MERDPVYVVSASGGPPKSGLGPVECAVIQNVADKPIRKVELRWQNAMNPDPAGEASIESAGLLEVVPALGRMGVVKPDSLSSWHSSQLALLVFFTDYNGNRWARRNEGGSTQSA